MTEGNAAISVEQKSPLPPPVPPSRMIRRGGWLVLAATLGSLAVLVSNGPLPFGPEASYRRGKAALLSSDREAVLRESERLVRIAGYEPHGWLLKGLLLTRLGKLDEAIVYLAKATELDALAVEANTAASQCYYQSGLYLQAIDAARKALRQDETCLDARRWLAAAYYDLGANSHAVGELERIAASAPGDPRPVRLLGLIAKDGELFPRAIEYYRESLRRDQQQPGLQELLAELAECQVKLSQFDEAIETLKECEKSAVVLTLQAECHSGLGRFDEAHDRLRQALKLDDHYFPAKLAQGRLLLDQGQVEQAERALDEAVQMEPAISQARFQWSQALRRLGKVAQADAELRRMQEIQALEREFSDLHDAAASRPDDAEIRYRAGELARQLGKPRLAQVWFRAALAINPRHVKARAAVQQTDMEPEKL